MDILTKASAGTLESSDVYVEIEPSANGLSVQVESVVEEQFGEAIRESVYAVLNECGITGAAVRIVDRGALDCVIRARVETAVLRGRETV